LYPSLNKPSLTGHNQYQMKKIFTLLTLALLAFGAKAQINTFPNNQGFEAAFDTGFNVMFIPNWVGSYVRPGVATQRIFSDSVNFRSGAAALAAIPTSTTPDTLVVNLDLSTSANLTMSLYARAEINGTGTRSAVAYASTSIDGGVTYGAATQIGDSVIFANTTGQSYNLYTYPFAANTNNQQNVRLRMIISRGAGLGSGTAARFLMDDVTFTSSTVDVFPPTAIVAVANSTSTVEVTFSEAVNASATNTANYTGISGLSSIVLNGTNDKATLTFSPALVEGNFYTLNVTSVADLAGNVMVGSSNFPIVFNDNTGNVKITEINYNDPGAGIDSLEFLEIKNLDANAINIGGWKFNSGITYTFPSGSQIQGGQYLVFARFPAAIQTVYGKTSTAWDANQALNNTGGETITLANASNVTINTVTYNNAAPWDTTANGLGHSLVLCDENADNSQSGNWTGSLDLVGTYIGLNIYGTPGGPCITVGINEVKSNDFALSAYPNPTADQVNVIFNSATSGNYNLKIVDLTGRVLNVVTGNAVFGKNHVNMNASTLASGVYLIVVESADGKSQLRFMKK